MATIPTILIIVSEIASISKPKFTPANHSNKLTLKASLQKSKYKEQKVLKATRSEQNIPTNCFFSLKAKQLANKKATKGLKEKSKPNFAY